MDNLDALVELIGIHKRDSEAMMMVYVTLFISALLFALPWSSKKAWADRRACWTLTGIMSCFSAFFFTMSFVYPVNEPLFLTKRAELCKVIQSDILAGELPWHHLQLSDKIRENCSVALSDS